MRALWYMESLYLSGIRCVLWGTWSHSTFQEFDACSVVHGIIRTRIENLLLALWYMESWRILLSNPWFGVDSASSFLSAPACGIHSPLTLKTFRATAIPFFDTCNLAPCFAAPTCGVHLPSTLNRSCASTVPDADVSNSRWLLSFLFLWAPRELNKCCCRDVRYISCSHFVCCWAVLCNFLCPRAHVLQLPAQLPTLCAMLLLLLLFSSH